MTQAGHEEIPGWFDFQEVYDLAVAEAPANAVFVEVGAWLGRSTAYLAKRIQARGDLGGRLHAVDTWQGSADIPYMLEVVRQHGGTIYPQFMENMKRSGVEDIVEPMQMTSVEAALRFPDKSVDFVFLDGSHKYDDVKQDIASWLPKLKPGGVIAGHDYQPLWPEVVRAVHESFPREAIGALGTSFWIHKDGAGYHPPRVRPDPRKCVVLVPVAHRIEPATDDALRQLEARGYTVRRVYGHAAIDQARSQMATDVLIEGFEELMWIDADVAFDPAAVDTLRNHREPVVCALYAKKGQRALACHTLPGTRQLIFGSGGGLVEIMYGATGFVLVRKHALLEMQVRLELPVCNAWAGRPVVPYFLPMVVDRQAGQPWYLGEDFAFFERLRQSGHRILADTTIRLWHLGSHGYSWEEAGSDQPRYATYHFNMPE